MSDAASELRALGENSRYTQFDGANATLLESFAAPSRRDNDTLTVRIAAPEFTSLCPKTGQPDFATIEVEYDPAALCVESKSFKLYLMTYRQHGAFHEEVTTQIGNDLVHLLDPNWLTVRGLFTPRGGISFHPTFTYCNPNRRRQREDYR